MHNIFILRHKHIYVYVWKFDQAVLELDSWAANFFFGLPRRDLNSHNWYTAASIFQSYV